MWRLYGRWELPGPIHMGSRGLVWLGLLLLAMVPATDTMPDSAVVVSPWRRYSEWETALLKRLASKRLAAHRSSLRGAQQCPRYATHFTRCFTQEATSYRRDEGTREGETLLRGGQPPYC